MDYLWIGMNKIPPSKSMIPINREDYMKDMNLYGKKLSSQVAADTPRQQIQICDTKKSFCIQIKHGIILEEILHKIITKKTLCMKYWLYQLKQHLLHQCVLFQCIYYRKTHTWRNAKKEKH